MSKALIDEIDTECGLLCCRSPASSFRKMDVLQSHEFDWAILVTELKKKAPLLYRIMCHLTSTSDHMNEMNCGDVHNPGICMAIAVLLKERNREICGVQILYFLWVYPKWLAAFFHAIT